MNSEKVKEIKELLKRKAEEYESQTYLDILTLINELESENEMLNKCYKVRAFNKLRAENKQLKDRIADLEKDNELLRNAKVVYENVDYCYEDLNKAENRINELEKENETLKDEITESEKEKRQLCKAINSIQKGFDNGEFISKDCQTKTLKQFAERLKEKMYENENGYKEFLSGKNAVAVDIVDFENCLEETLKEFIK